MQFLGEYNRAFSGEPRSLATQIREIPTMARHLWMDLWQGDVVDFLLKVGALCINKCSRISVNRASMQTHVIGRALCLQLRFLLVLAVVFVYLLAPFDLLPEAVYGFLGLADDLLMLLFVVLHVISLYRTALVAAH